MKKESTFKTRLLLIWRIIREILYGIILLCYLGAILFVLYCVYKVGYSLYGMFFLSDSSYFLSLIFYIVILSVSLNVCVIMGDWFIDMATPYDEKYRNIQNIKQREEYHLSVDVDESPKKKDGLFSMKTVVNIIIGVSIYNIIFGKDED